MPHSGFRVWQIERPCRISQWWASTRYCGGIRSRISEVAGTLKHAFQQDAPRIAQALADVALAVEPRLVDQVLPARTLRAGRSASVWPVVAQALDELRQEYDVVVIEGEGSPAAINLHDSDIVNMRVALHANAASLLVTDIDRGGAFASVRGLWASLSGVEVQGYEIHHGQTIPHSAMAAAGDIAYPVMPEGLTWQNAAGKVLGLYLHGLFEDPGVLQALFGAVTSTLDSVFDGLADYIERHFEHGVLPSLIA